MDRLSVRGHHELEATRSSHINPHAAAALDNSHQNVVARWTPDHSAWRVEVNVDAADNVHRATACASAVRGSHLCSEDLSQQTCDRVTVELQLRLLHAPPPVAPNRSVLIKGASS